MAARRMGLTLAALVFMYGVALPTACAAEPTPLGSNGELLSVTGTVLMPDGSPAAGASVRSKGQSDMPPIIVLTDDAGRFELQDMFGGGAQLHASSADGRHQTTMSVPAAVTRTLFASPIELKLTPADTHEVTVVSDGKPVAGAHVSIGGSGFTVDGLTGADGRALLHFPPGKKLTQLTAWHADLGVDGVGSYDHAFDGDMTRLSLRALGSHTIRVVDTEGKAVGDLELGINVTTEDSDWIISRDIEAAHVRTNAEGTATVAWVPRDGLKRLGIHIIGSGWKIDDIDRDRMHEGLSTVRARRERTVEGRLIMPDGESAEGILISGFGFGPGSSGDIPYSRARPDGSFTLQVPADHGYVLGIADLEWASDRWSGMILMSNGEKTPEMVIDIYPATPVSIRVTRGADRQPVADAWIHVSSLGSVEIVDVSGGKRSGSAGVRGWLLTDSKGMATTGVGMGEHEFRLTSGKWNEERTIDVGSKEPLNIEFHRNWLGDRHLSGRLTLDGAPYQPSPHLLARAWAQRPRSMPLRFAPLVDADGTLKVAFDADNLSLLFVDRDNRQSGFATLGSEASDVEIAMQPTATYSGTLLDENSDPMADRTLRLTVAKTRYDVVAPQQTDEAGRFQFTGVAGNVPLRLSVDNESDGPQYFLSGGDRLFLPGEVRSGDVVKARRRDTSRSKAKPSVPLADSVASICRSASLSRMYGLIALEGDDSRDVTKLASTILDHREFGIVTHYFVLDIAADRLKAEAKALADYAWPLPAAGEVVLVVLDGDQKTVAARRIQADNPSAAMKSAAEFLKQHKPHAADAVALVAAARAEAQASSRRVWFVHGGPRCGPCFRLARWMDDHHAMLEKDYVIVKAMGGLDKHVAEALEELPSQQHGIPWHAITEPDGTVLVTSEGPLGNIGMPSSVEGIRHLRQMLERTATKLTSEDVNALVESLATPR